MARYIEDLNECTDPVSGDFMWVVDASAGSTDKDRKVDVGKFARLAVAQTFTATQTFSNVSVGTSGGATAITKPADGHTLAALDAVSLAAGAKFTFPATNGLLVVTSVTSGRSSVYLLTFSTVTVISQDTNGYSTTMSTANKINVYHNGSFFEIENGYATSRSVSWIVFGY